MPNPGLSPEIMQAMQRRQGGESSPALNQVSPGAPSAQLPPPVPQAGLTQASAPQGPPAGEAPAMPKFEAQNRKDLITLALIEQLKNDNKLDKEKAKMGQQPSPEPAQASVAPPPVAPAPPQGGGNGMSMNYGMGGGELSPGFQQPMPVSAMQSDYGSGNYSGMNNYGQGTKGY